mmetsp:Transcript_25283/g.53911  ORF Transcript_25283/g.53911 Transcript_25283/m.53911 type:complete len:248 (-) Transcript_25283:1154-1897(-)
MVRTDHVPPCACTSMPCLSKLSKRTNNEIYFVHPVSISTRHSPRTRSHVSFCFARTISTLTTLCFVVSTAKGWLPNPFTPTLFLASLLVPSSLFRRSSSSPRPLPSSSSRRPLPEEASLLLLLFAVLQSSPSGKSSSSGTKPRVWWQTPSESMTHKSTRLPLPRSLRIPDRIARRTRSIPSCRVRDDRYPSSRTAIAAIPPLPRAANGRSTSADPCGWIARRKASFFQTPPTIRFAPSWPPLRKSVS